MKLGIVGAMTEKCVEVEERLKDLRPFDVTPDKEHREVSEVPSASI